MHYHTQRGHCIEAVRTVDHAGSRVNNDGSMVEEWWETVQNRKIGTVEHSVIRI